VSSNTNLGPTPVNQGYVQLIHIGETGGIDGTLRTIYDGDGTASDLQIASNAVKISTQLYIGSDTIQEYIQDVVGTMFTTGSYTNISTNYDDINGNIDLNATGAISSIIGGTGINATGSGDITIAIDSSVVTLTGTQTLTNKTLTSPTINAPTINTSLTFDSVSLTAIQTSLEAFADNNTSIMTSAAIDDRILSYGYSTTTGTVTSVGITPGSLIDVSGGPITSSGSITIDVDLNEATDMNGIAMVGTDQFIVLDGTTESKKPANEIPLSILNNDAGFITTTSTDTLSNKTLASPAFTGTATGVNLTLSGDLTVNGTTTTLNTTNLKVTDNIIELNQGVASNSNDSGIIIERGSTGDNAMIIWDESQDRWVLGTTTATADATGDITFTEGSVQATTFYGSLSGNASTATKLGTPRNIAGVAFDGSASIDIPIGNLSDVTITSPTNNQALIYNFGTGIWENGSAGLTYNGSTANGVLTYGSSTTIDVEQYLTFNGSTLAINDLNIRDDGSNTFIENATGSLLIRNQAHGSKLQFGTEDSSGTLAYVLNITGDNHRVGIGTTTPGYKLEIEGSTNTDLLALDGAGTGFRLLGKSGDGSISNSMVYRLYLDYGLGTATNGFIDFYRGGDGASGYLTFGTSGTEKMRIDGSGNVGIGTQSPTNFGAGFTNLQISGSTAGSVQTTDSTNSATTEMMTSSGVGYVGTRSNHQVRFKSNNTTAMTIDTSQRVGIGTNSPSTITEIKSTIPVLTLTDDQNKSWTSSDTTMGKLSFKTSDSSGIGAHETAFISVEANLVSSTTPNGELVFGTAGINAAATEKMRIQSDGKVGIGTSSPSDLLHIADTASSNALVTMRVQNSNGYAEFGTQSTYARILSQGTLLYAGSSNPQIWYINGSTAMTLNTTGLGIGTSPAEKLDVNGNIRIGNGGGLFVEHSNASLGGTVIHPNGGTYRTTTSTLTGAIKITLPTGTGTIADMISFWVDVFDYATDESFSCYIAGYAYQTAGGNEWVNEEALILSANQDKDFTVRFGHDGSNHCVYIGELTSSWSYPQITIRNVQIGYSSDVDTYNDGWSIGFESTAFDNLDHTQTDNFPYAKGLESSSNMGAYISGTEKFRFTTGGAFHATNDVVAYSTTPSDEKLKTNIKDIDYGLDTILKLNPKQYDWKKDNRHDIGFIAQDVEKVIPEIVKDNEWFDDKIKTMDYEKLTAVLIKAVQEQQQQINELKEKLNG
jgi:hypothetical protein